MPRSDWLRRLPGRVVNRLIRTRLEADTLHSILLDLRYGGFCGGKIPTRFAHLGAVRTEGLSYHHLHRLFTRARIAVRPADVLVDLGCGKGRVINYWLNRGYRNRMVGLELDPDIAERTRRRLARFLNVAIVTGDAIEHLPHDGTIFYAFNPFNCAIVTRLKETFRAAFAEREVVLLYSNCVCLALFEGDPEWTIERLGRIAYPAAVLRKRGGPAGES
jgi:SAM-dependent methyltransferase